MPRALRRLRTRLLHRERRFVEKIDQRSVGSLISRRAIGGHRRSTDPVARNSSAPRAVLVSGLTPSRYSQACRPLAWIPRGSPIAGGQHRPRRGANASSRSPTRQKEQARPATKRRLPSSGRCDTRPTLIAFGRTFRRSAQWAWQDDDTTPQATLFAARRRHDVHGRVLAFAEELAAGRRQRHRPESARWERSAAKKERMTSPVTAPP